MTPVELKKTIRKLIATLDSSGEEVRHQTAREGRKVQLFAEDNGMASLWAYLAADDAIAIYNRVHDLALNLPEDKQYVGKQYRDKREKFKRGIDQKRADVFTDLFTQSLMTSGSIKSIVKPLVHVTVPVELLAQLASNPDSVTALDSSLARNYHRVSPPELAGYGVIPTSMATESIADASLRRLVTDPVGKVIDYSTTSYCPPTALSRYIRARDKTCRFPGCLVPARNCDLDHTAPWKANGLGGATTASNLGALCRHHHRLKHEGRWQVSQSQDATYTWISPAGRVYCTYIGNDRPSSRQRYLALASATSEHIPNNPGEESRSAGYATGIDPPPF